jgi:adenylate cyclase
MHEPTPPDARPSAVDPFRPPPRDVGRVIAERKRGAAYQPPQGTSDEIAAWLLGAARDERNALDGFDEFCWRLVGAGLPVARILLNVETLHPQFLGYSLRWWRDQRRSEYMMIRHEIADTSMYRDSPIQHVRMSGEVVRRRLEGRDAPDDFPILADLRAHGMTDYLVLPVRGGHGRRYIMTFASDRPGGFAESDCDALQRLAGLVGILTDLFSAEQVARNILDAYLGSTTGPRVLSGQIRRGSLEQIRAVIWMSDIRDFTERSDRLSGERVIELLNACFDAQAEAINRHGGEVLKFIGDGLLAIFPVADAGFAGQAARAALDAAQQALQSIQRLNQSPLMAGEAPLAIVIALHIGQVMYGNIGAADRLDFTVIGPAVNLTSRAEAFAKALNLPIVVTDELQAVCARKLVSLGRHRLRGLSGERELFTLAQTAGEDTHK